MEMRLLRAAPLGQRVFPLRALRTSGSMPHPESLSVFLCCVFVASSNSHGLWETTWQSWQFRLNMIKACWYSYNNSCISTCMPSPTWHCHVLHLGMSTSADLQLTSTIVSTSVRHFGQPSSTTCSESVCLLDHLMQLCAVSGKLPLATGTECPHVSPGCMPDRLVTRESAVVGSQLPTCHLSLKASPAMLA